MREPKRIPKILQRLQNVWQKHPDLRLGQIIINAMKTECTSLFYVEDECLIKLIEKLSGLLES